MQTRGTVQVAGSISWTVKIDQAVHMISIVLLTSKFQDSVVHYLDWYRGPSNEQRKGKKKKKAETKEIKENEHNDLINTVFCSKQNLISFCVKSH